MISLDIHGFLGQWRKHRRWHAKGSLWEYDLRDGVVWDGSIAAGGDIDSLSLSGNGKFLAVSNVGLVDVYRHDGRQLEVSWQYFPVSRLPAGIFPTPVFSSNGRSIAASGSAGLDWWELSHRRMRRLAPSCPCEYAEISSSWSVAVIARNNFAEAWVLRSGTQAGQWLSSAMVMPQTIVVSADGSEAAWSDADDYVEVVDVRADRRPAVFTSAGAAEGDLQFALQGQLILVAPGTRGPSGRSRTWLR